MSPALWDREIERIRKEIDIPQKTLAYNIERGKLGLNVGAANGMDQLNKSIYGTHRGRYYLIGADSGVGKTTIADYMYVYSLYRSCKLLGIPLEILYFSFEISLVSKKAKFASLLYWDTHGEYLPYETILGMRHTLTAEQDLKLTPIVAEIEDMFDHIQLIEATKNPYEIWRLMLHRASAYGDIIRDDTKKEGPGAIVNYVNQTPDVFKVTVVDHLALMDETSGQSLKQTMDLASSLFVKARNLWDETIVAIQQFNTELQTASRENKPGAAYIPSRQDFGDSRYTFRDADVVLGLTRPVDYQLTKVGKFDFSKPSGWGEYFLQLHIMKNRYGPTGGYVPLFMNYTAGRPEELPSDTLWDANTLLQADIVKRAAEQRALRNK